MTFAPLLILKHAKRETDPRFYRGAAGRDAEVANTSELTFQAPMTQPLKRPGVVWNSLRLRIFRPHTIWI